jgi:hypothetical protein
MLRMVPLPRFAGEEPEASPPDPPPFTGKGDHEVVEGAEPHKVFRMDAYAPKQRAPETGALSHSNGGIDQIDRPA